MTKSSMISKALPILDDPFFKSFDRLMNRPSFMPSTMLSVLDHPAFRLTSLLRNHQSFISSTNLSIWDNPAFKSISPLMNCQPSLSSVSLSILNNPSFKTFQNLMSPPLFSAIKNSFVNDLTVPSSSILKLQKNLVYMDFIPQLAENTFFHELYTPISPKNNSIKKLRIRAIAKQKSKSLDISIGDLIEVWQLLDSFSKSTQDDATKYQLLCMQITIFILLRVTLFKMKY